MTMQSSLTYISSFTSIAFYPLNIGTISSGVLHVKKHMRRKLKVSHWKVLFSIPFFHYENLF